MGLLMKMACLSIVMMVAGMGVGQSGGSGALQGRSDMDRAIVLDVVSCSGGAKELRITDNGAVVAPERVQVLTAGETAESQSQIVLVIDAVNSTPEEVARSEEAIEELLKSARSPLPRPTSVIVLSDAAAEHPPQAPKTETISVKQRELFAHRIPATTDAARLREALSGYKLGLRRILAAQAGVGEEERVRLSLEAMSFVANSERAEPGAKIVVWMSPGWPFLARAEARSSPQIFDSIVYFSDLLRSARMMVSMVDPRGVTSQDFSGQTENFLLASRPGVNRSAPRSNSVPVTVTDNFYRNFLAGVRREADSNPNDLTLQVLAIQSGGLVLQHNNDLKAQLAACVADADRLVSVRYVPEAGRGAMAYHAVEVRQAASSETLRARRGFYVR